MRNLNKFNQENFVGEGLSPVFSKIIFPQTAMQNRLWEYYFLFTTSWCGEWDLNPHENTPTTPSK